MAMTVGSLRARIDADIDGALRGIRQVQREMKTLTKTETVVRIRLDISSARSQLQPFLQQLRSIQRASLNTTVNLKVKTDLQKARADLLDFKKSANNLSREIRPIEIRLKRSDVQKQLQPILSQLRTLQRGSVSVNVRIANNAPSTIIAINGVKRALDGLRRPVDIKLRMDAGQSRAQINRAITQLRSLQRSSASITVTATVTRALQQLQRVLDAIRDIRQEARTPVRLVVDSATLRALRDVQRMLSQLRGNGVNWGGHANGLRGIGASAGAANGPLAQLWQTLQAFTAGYVGIQGITAAMGALKSVFIDFNNVLQQSEVGFTTLFANTGISLDAAQEKANGLLESLKAFAIPTPFELVDLAPLAQQAMAFGLVNKSAKDTGAEVTALLRDVGDAAYGLGRGQVGVDRIMLALGQMKVATRVMGQEMLQMQQVGINAWGYLADATGKSTREVKKLVEDGLMPADAAIKAIRAGLRRDFGGGMERASKTFAGAAAQIKDALSVKISDALKPQFNDLTDAAVRFAGSLDSSAFEARMNSLAASARTGLDVVATAWRFASDTITKNEGLVVAAISAIGVRMLWLGAVTKGQPVVALALFALGIQTASNATGQFTGVAQIAVPAIYTLSAALAALQIQSALAAGRSAFLALTWVQTAPALLAGTRAAIAARGALGGLNFMLASTTGGLVAAGVALPAMTAAIGIGAIAWQKYQEKVSLVQMAQADLDASSKQLAQSLEDATRFAGADPKAVESLTELKTKYDELRTSVGGLQRFQTVELPKVREAIKISTKLDALDKRVLTAEIDRLQREANNEANKLKIKIDAEVEANPTSLENIAVAFYQQYGAMADYLAERWEKDRATAENYLRTVSAALGNFWKDVQLEWAKFRGDLSNGWQAFVNWLPESIRNPIRSVTNIVRSEWKRTIDDISGAWGGFLNFFSSTRANHEESGGSAPAPIRPTPIGPPVAKNSVQKALDAAKKAQNERQAQRDRAEAERRARERAKVTIPTIIPTAGTGSESAAEKEAKKAAAAALKLQKDQLADAARSWDLVADAAERSADRQIKALKGIQDSLISVFDGLKQNLIQAGIISDPLQPILDKLAARLNLAGKANAIASSAQSKIDYARGMGGAARSRQEQLGGLDGVVPSKYGAGINNGEWQTPAYMQRMFARVGESTAVQCGQAISDALRRPAFATSVARGAGGKTVRPVNGRLPEGAVVAQSYGTKAQHFFVVHTTPDGVQRKLESTTAGGRRTYRSDRPITARDLQRMNRAALPPGVPEYYVNSGNAALQARANATGRAQVAVRDMPSAPAVPVESDIKAKAAELIAGLSTLSDVPKGWGGSVQNRPGSEARFAIQTFLTTPEGRALIAALAPGFSAKQGNTSDQAAWYLRGEANKADAKSTAELMPLRIKEAEKATTEFAQAKARELRVLRDSSKWLKSNAFDALGLAKAQEESKIRAEAGNDATLKGLPIKERDKNITARVQAAVHALTETYRHNAFAAHIQRISELDKEYAGLGATTLEAQIAQKVWNQESAASLTTDEKQLQITKELRNERAKYAQDALQNARAATTAVLRSIEDLDVVNPVDALKKQFGREDEDRRLIDPGWIPSLDLIKERARQIEGTFKKWSVESTRESLESIKELMDDANLSFAQTYEKFGQMWRDYISKKSAVAPDDQIGGTAENAAYLAAFNRSRANGLGEPNDASSYGQLMDELIIKSTTLLKTSRDAFKEVNDSNLTIVDKAKAARDEVLKMIPVLRALAIANAAPMAAFEATVAQIKKDQDESVDKAQQTFDAEKIKESTEALSEYTKKLYEVKREMQRESFLNSILDPNKRDLAQWKFSLQDQGLSDSDIEGLMPERRIQMRAQAAMDHIQQFLSGLNSTVSSAFDSLFEAGPGKFFSSLLSGLQSTLQQMASQILSSYVQNWITNMIGGALGDGGGSNAPAGWHAPMALPGFSTGLPRVYSEEMAVRVHKNEAILTAQQANEWRAQRRENGRIPSRGGSGASGAAVINAPVTYNVGTIVANNPQEFHRKLRTQRSTSRTEAQRDLALNTQRGVRSL